MKIAIDCRMINMSGIGSYLKGVINYFLEIELNQYVLFGNKRELSIYSHYQNCIIEHTEIPIFTIKELIDFPVTKINQCDCFYTPNYNIPLGIKIPIYSTIHDVVFLDIPNLTSLFGKIIRYIYLKRSYLISRSVFTVSEFSKERIVKRLGKCKTKIVVTYNGVAESFYNFKKPVVLDDYYVFVGNIKAHKGIRTLLAAFSKLKLLDTKAQLLIVGDYKNFQSTDSEVQELINNQVSNKGLIFTGKVDDITLKELISRAKTLVQPSLYEGFGIPPLESMILGTPVILSDIQVFKELYNDFPVTYFQVNNSDDLFEKMLKSSGGRVCLSAKQKEKYSYRNSAKLILTTISSK